MAPSPAAPGVDSPWVDSPWVDSPRVESTAWSDPRVVQIKPAPREPAALLPRRAAQRESAGRALEPRAAALRLTGRGAAAMASAAVLLICAGLVALAWLSAPSSEPARSTEPAPVAITVERGDTLWSLAARIAPDRDPREVISTLQHMNGLDSVALQPGQVIRTR